MQKDNVSITEISALSLFSQTNSLRALCLSVVILSLAGLPPLVGFFGKLFIFRAAIEEGLVWLALVGGLASVIGAYYYLRIVYLIYFGATSDNLSGSMPFINRIVLTGSALAMLLGAINLFGLQDLITVISKNFLS